MDNQSVDDLSLLQNLDAIGQSNLTELADA
jgi:hypothetical protein